MGIQGDLRDQGVIVSGYLLFLQLLLFADLWAMAIGSANL